MRCDHCERLFRELDMVPVRACGFQSYLGHVLTGHPEERRILLCQECSANLRQTGIEGVTVVDDDEAMATRDASVRDRVD